MQIELDFAAVLSQWPLLAKGVAWTLGLTAISALLGGLAGVGCAWVRTQGAAWSRALVGVYVELFRNTPFIVQLFFIFFGLFGLNSIVNSLPNGKLFRLICCAGTIVGD